MDSSISLLFIALDLDTAAVGVDRPLEFYGVKLVYRRIQVDGNPKGCRVTDSGSSC